MKPASFISSEKNPVNFKRNPEFMQNRHEDPVLDK